MFDSLAFKNKHILITGASSGIGREIAVYLSKLGATISLTARSEGGLSQTLELLSPGEHRFFCYDLADCTGIESLYERICLDGNKLDGMVFAAGKDICRPLKLTTQHVLHDIMNLNFFSFVEMCRIFSKKKFYKPGGAIVVLSSIAAQRGRKGLTAYSASKAAIDGAVKVLGAELADLNIRINSVAPSFIDTNMLKNYVDLFGEGVLNAINERQCLGIGKPCDVASVVAFLLSDLSRFITGSVVPVDGGYLSV